MKPIDELIIFYRLGLGATQVEIQVSKQKKTTTHIWKEFYGR